MYDVVIKKFTFAISSPDEFLVVLDVRTAHLFLGRYIFVCDLLYSIGTIFTVLHGMQTRSSDENSVCLSVRLSDTRVNCDETVERSVQIFIPHERSFSLVF